MKRLLRLRDLEPDPAQDIREELESHFELEVEALVAGGMAEDEARREAERRLVAHRLSESEARRCASSHRRRRRRASQLSFLLRETRFALRLFLRRREFSLAAVAVIAVGTGVTTLVFGVSDGILNPDLPYPRADELVYLENPAHTVPRYRDWRDRITSLQSASAVWELDVRVAGQPALSTLHAALVTPDFLPMFGATLALGRPFQADDFVGEPRSVILSDGLWRREFGADSTVIGRTLQLEGLQLTVVGVLDGAFVSPLALAGEAEDLYAPLDADRPDLQQDHQYVLGVFGRMRTGLDASIARMESERIAEELFRVNPARYTSRGSGQPISLRTAPLREAFTAGVERPLLLLFGAVLLVLLMGCVNLANLLLARGFDRTDEVGLRYALGAKRLAVVRQLLVESLTLSMAGGAAGLGLAAAGLRGLLAVIPAATPFVDQIGIDLRVVGFSVAVTALTGVLFGLLPAWFVSGVSPRRALAGHPKGGGEGRGARRLQRSLILLQTGLALVLVTSAGLLFNSFVRLRSVNLGFNPDGLLVVGLDLRGEQGPGTREELDKALLDAVLQVPGVGGAALGESAPFLHFSGRISGTFASSITSDAGSVIEARAGLHPVTAGYLELLGANLQGRTILQGDEALDPTPAVISRELAEGLFPSRNAIGRSFETDGRTFSVVGIVSGLHYWGQRATVHQIFLPWQSRAENASLVVRASADPGRLVPLIRDEISSLAPAAELGELYLMKDRVEESLAGPRFLMLAALGFALFAGVVAFSGIYGVILYVVARRRRELSIRLALGAPPSQLMWMAMRQVLLPAALGLGAGAVASLATARLLSSLLFGVGPGHWPTHLAAILLLGSAALLASLAPSWEIRSSGLPRYLQGE